MKIVAYIFLLITTAALSCQTKPAARQAAADTASQTPTVEVVHPAPQTFSSEILISGTVMPNRQVMLHAMESGYVHQMRKDIGDRVRKGEVIAVLRNPELVQQLKEAEANHDHAAAMLLTAGATLEKMKAVETAKKATADRLNGIFEKTPSLTPMQEVERVRAEAATAAADTKIAQVELEAAQKEVVSMAAIQDAVAQRYAMLAVKAPFDGVVTRRYVDPGAAVASGLSSSQSKPIVEVQEIDPVRISLPLPARDAATVKQGMKVTVSFPESQAKPIDATISRTASSLDPASKTMEAEIDLPNPQGNIRPGMYAKVHIHAETSKESLALPMEAQTVYQDAYFVLLVVDDKVKRVPLKKGLVGKDYFEVLNDDITAKSQVIVRGKSLAKDGQVVEAVLKE